MPDCLPATAFSRVAAFVLCLAPLVPAARAQQAEAYREWTSTDNKKVEAVLLGMEGEMVKLKLRTGAIVAVPLTRFTAEDQALAKAAKPSAAPIAQPSLAITTGKAGAATGLYEAEKNWPRTVAVADISPVTVVKEDASTKEFIYRSEHYEFRCDSKLGANVVREFNRIFEATHLVNCRLPLDLKPTPEPGQEFFVAQLYTSKADYLTNGGLPGSAGVYQSGKKALSVPLASLGVKMVGSRVSLEKSKDEDNATLIHETTHQMMNHWLRHLPVWYIEGSAEYVSILKYDHGRFSLAGLNDRLRTFLQRRGADGKNFTMLDLEELTSLNGATWAAALTAGRHQASQNYASAALLTYYFYHLDDKGDAAHMIDFLRAVENAKGKDATEAAFKQHLLRERSFEALKTDVKKALRKEGLNIEFASAGKNQPPSTTTQ